MYSYITVFCSKIPPKAGTPQIYFCKDAVFLPYLTMGITNFKSRNGIVFTLFHKNKNKHKNIFASFDLYCISRVCKNLKFVKC